MKSSHFRRTSGRRATDGLLLALVALLLAACNYGFEGGGFPPHIRTIYIAPLDNQTPQFDLDQKIYARMLDELPRKLGVRVAGEGNADAVLRGVISRYDDAAQAFRPGDAETAPGVSTHEVRITISAQLVDVRENVIRWESTGLLGRGIYRPDNQSEDVGQTAAIESILQQIIDGAQSQW
jgi:hypothetical protein